jgi:hypothetical protein
LVPPTFCRVIGCHPSSDAEHPPLGATHLLAGHLLPPMICPPKSPIRCHPPFGGIRLPFWCPPPSDVPLGATHVLTLKSLHWVPPTAWRRAIGYHPPFGGVLSPIGCHPHSRESVGSIHPMAWITGLFATFLPHQSSVLRTPPPQKTTQTIGKQRLRSLPAIGQEFCCFFPNHPGPGCVVLTETKANLLR